MKYRLTEDWLEYKKGQTVEKKDVYDLLSSSPNACPFVIETLLSLLLKTGILEEVKEESPIMKLIQKTDLIFNHHLLTHEEVAENMFKRAIEDYIRADAERIKTLLLSLKK